MALKDFLASAFDQKVNEMSKKMSEKVREFSDDELRRQYDENSNPLVQAAVEKEMRRRGIL